MKRYALMVLVGFSIALLIWKEIVSRHQPSSKAALDHSDQESSASVAKTHLRTNELGVRSRRTNTSVQSRGVSNPTNSYTLVYSNLTLTTVTVDSPLEKLIGTDEYEALAKKDFEENIPFEKKLNKIKDIIELESPDSGRIYSAVRMVYEMRSDVADNRKLRSELEHSTNERIREIDSDEKIPASERAMLIQSEVNQINIQTLSLEMGAKNSYERFLRQMVNLVGELNEATLDRLNAFEPQFSAKRLKP
jgi:hypothetical protein